MNLDIQELNDRIDDLESRRDELDKSIDEHKAVLRDHQVVYDGQSYKSFVESYKARAIIYDQNREELNRLLDSADLLGDAGRVLELSTRITSIVAKRERKLANFFWDAYPMIREDEGDKILFTDSAYQHFVSRSNSYYPYDRLNKSNYPQVMVIYDLLWMVASSDSFDNAIEVKFSSGRFDLNAKNSVVCEMRQAYLESIKEG